MPNTTLEEALKEAYAIAPAHVVIYHTIHIRQLAVQSPIFMVQARQSITATDENGDVHTFSPVGFQFSLPPSSDEGFQSLNISIDNIDRRVTDFINIAQTSQVPVEILYRPFRSDDLTKPQMKTPLLLFLKEVQVVNGTVTGKATFMDVINKKFPLDLYGRDRFPTLG